MAPTMRFCRDTCLMSQKSMGTAQKKKFSIKDFFSKYDHLGNVRRIWSHLLKKSLMENFIFCAVGLTSIVFDGYSRASTKDHEHKRRERSHPPCPDVQPKKNTQLQYSQSLFLTSNSNKTQLINLLSDAPKEAGHIVKTSNDDTDTLIVYTALNFATERMSVRMIATDTDTLIMLLYFWNNEMANILMLSVSICSRR